MSKINKQEIAFRNRDWSIFENYAIEEQTVAIYTDETIRLDVLCYSGKVKQKYNPFLCKELPAEISKLRTTAAGNEEDIERILRFAQQYGSLGYSYPNPQQSGQFHFNRLVSVDPILWILSHANIFYFCLKIIKELKKYDIYNIESTMKDFYNYLMINHSDLRLLLPHFVGGITYCGLGKDIWEMYFKREWYHILAIRVLEFIVNKSMQSICPQLYISLDINNSDDQPDTTALPGFTRSYQYSSLIEVAYEHLATTITHGSVKQCDGCGELFIQVDPRARYCPRKERGKDSRCSLSKRQRKKKENRKDRSFKILRSSLLMGI